MKHFLSCYTVVLFLFIFSRTTVAQNFSHAAAIPGVNFGYIFGAGISVGAEISYSPFVFKSGNGKTAAGLYAGINYFHSKGEIYKETWYHTISYGATVFSDARFMAKAGISRTVLPWGRNKMNKFKSRKRSIDLDVSYAPFANGVFVGYRLYFPGEACFGLDISTVNMVYTAYRYNFASEMFEVNNKH